MDPSKYPFNVCPKAGTMCMNRLFIDEDAVFELSGVYDFKNPWKSATDKIKIIPGTNPKGKVKKF